MPLIAGQPSRTAHGHLAHRGTECGADAFDLLQNPPCEPFVVAEQAEVDPPETPSRRQWSILQGTQNIMRFQVKGIDVQAGGGKFMPGIEARCSNCRRPNVPTGPVTTL